MCTSVIPLQSKVGTLPTFDIEGATFDIDGATFNIEGPNMTFNIGYDMTT